LRVRDALDIYLAENGFTHAEYEAKWTPASFFGVLIPVPNTVPHQRGIRLHDLHHLATGFGTDIAGEGEISAWELRGGLGDLNLYVSSLVLFGTVVGSLSFPRRTLRAGRSSKKENLFRSWSDYSALLELTVGELRERLGVPAQGIAKGRKLHSRAPRAVANPSITES
jgi:hypothetical protein